MNSSKCFITTESTCTTVSSWWSILLLLRPKELAHIMIFLFFLSCVPFWFVAKTQSYPKLKDTAAFPTSGSASPESLRCMDWYASHSKHVCRYHRQMYILFFIAVISDPTHADNFFQLCNLLHKAWLGLLATVCFLPVRCEGWMRLTRLLTSKMHRVILSSSASIYARTSS